MNQNGGLEIRGVLYLTWAQYIIYFAHLLLLFLGTGKCGFKMGYKNICSQSWLMVKNRCPTRDRILSWGLQTDPRYLYCNAAAESIVHCYFDCNFTREIWRTIAEKCNFTSLRKWSALLSQLNSHTSNKVRKTLLLFCLQATLYTLDREKQSTAQCSVYFFRWSSCPNKADG